MIDGHAHAEVGGPLRANGEALGQTSAGNSQDVGAGRLAPTKAEKLGPARAPGLAHANAGKLERLLRPNPFSGDLGEMSADMAEALAAPDPGSSIKGIVAALTDGRVLVPALPHEHPGRTEDGGIAEHVSEPDPTAGAVAEAATLSVRIPGGRFAMPVFSCAERLVACYPGARPIPVLGRHCPEGSYGIRRSRSRSARTQWRRVHSPGTECGRLRGRRARVGCPVGRSASP